MLGHFIIVTWMQSDALALFHLSVAIVFVLFIIQPETLFRRNQLSRISLFSSRSLLWFPRAFLLTDYLFIPFW